MSEKKPLIVKEARQADYDDFKKIKEERGFTDAGTLTYLLNLTRGENKPTEDLKKALKAATEKLQRTESENEGFQAEIESLKTEVLNLKNREPEVKEVEVVKEIEKKLAPGQFVISAPPDLAAHMRKARSVIRKDYPKYIGESYESDLAVYALKKFLNYEYSRFA